MIQNINNDRNKHNNRNKNLNDIYKSNYSY